MTRRKALAKHAQSPTERIECGRMMFRIMQERIQVTVAGIATEMTRLEALLRQTWNDSIGGDAAARREVIELTRIGYNAENDPYTAVKEYLNEWPRPTGIA